MGEERSVLGARVSVTPSEIARATYLYLYPCPSRGEGSSLAQPKITLSFLLWLTVLLLQNHHPRVLPKAFQWKVVSMCKSSRASGAGPRNYTGPVKEQVSVHWQHFECNLC